MLAHRHAHFHFLSARRAFVHPHRHVRPLALHSQRDRRPPMQIRNLAERMSPRPHRVRLRRSAGDKKCRAAPSPSASSAAARPRAVANKNPVVLQILQQVLGNLPRRNRERKPPVVSQVERIPARRDHQQCERLAFRARRNVIHPVRPRNIPILLRNRRNRNRRSRIALRRRIHQNIPRPSRRRLICVEFKSLCSFVPRNLVISQPTSSRRSDKRRPAERRHRIIQQIIRTRYSSPDPVAPPAPQSLRRAPAAAAASPTPPPAQSNRTPPATAP